MIYLAFIAFVLLVCLLLLGEWVRETWALIEVRRDAALAQSDADFAEHADEAVRIANAPAFARIADILAANEAARFDADGADWDEPAEWREGRS